jgi:uncharacterized protein (TIGR02246 family)
MPSAVLQSVETVVASIARPLQRAWRWRHRQGAVTPSILLAGLVALPLALLLSLAAPALAVVSTAAEPAPSCAPVSRSTVEGLFAHWNAALASGDAGQVAALYSLDALLLPTLSDQPRDTPAAIRAYFEGFLARSPEGRIDSRRISLGCNTALDAGTYSFRLAGADGGGAEWVQARYTFAYVHGPDGWRIQHHHSSLQPAPPT